MPFKSQSQRRLFHALQRRGEISKKKVDEWQRETGNKKLPERVKKTKTAEESWAKLAAVLAEAGLTKESNLVTGLSKAVARPFLPMALAAGGGAILGGEGNRTQGAIAGLLGAWLAQGMLGPGVSRALLLDPKYKEMTVKQIQEAAKTNEALRAQLAASQRATSYALGGAGSVGGGFAAKKLEEHNRDQALASGMPAGYDIGGKYTGFYPDDEIPDNPLF